jgi:hypothetical protein
MGTSEFGEGAGVSAGTLGALEARSGRALLALTLPVLLLLLTLVRPDTAEARGPLYRYLDENGVMHFSNVPSDDRYRAIELKPRGRHLRKHREPPSDVRYDEIIRWAAKRQGLEPALVKAVIAAESNFDSQAVSRRGAQGLMQLMPATAASLGVEDAFVPEKNVGGGTRYLKDMLNRYGDVSRALAAYNAGPKAVDRYGGIPPYRETRDYVARVLTYYRGYRNQIGLTNPAQRRLSRATTRSSAPNAPNPTRNQR